MRNPNRQAERRRALDTDPERPDTLIIYNSKNGSTMEYANWMAQELSCDVMPFVKNRLGLISVYQNIIYGGWMRASEIVGLNLVLNNYENFNMAGKNFYVFGVGLGDPEDEDYITKIRQFNYIEKLPRDHYFHLPGRYHRKDLHMSEKTMLKAFGDKMFDGLTDEESQIIRTRMEDGYDGVDRKNIKPVVNEIRRLRETVIRTGMSR